MTSYQSYNNNYGGHNNQDYNGNNHTGGGGFSTTNNYAGDNNTGVNEGFSSSQKPQLRTILTPVTIKQINDSTQPVPDGEFVVNNVELNLVSFVGIVRNVVDNAASLVITIEDGTGSIDVRKWVEEGKEESQVQELNKYVFVTGGLKEFSGRKQLQHATIRPVSDYNEVIYHHLSAIESHLAAQGVTHKSNDAQPQHEGLFVPHDGHSNSSGDLQERIYQFALSNNGKMPDGTPLQLIAQTFNLLDSDARRECNKLVDDGRVYTGYDDNAFIAV